MGDMYILALFVFPLTVVNAAYTSRHQVLQYYYAAYFVFQVVTVCLFSKDSFQHLLMPHRKMVTMVYLKLASTLKN